MSNSPLPIFGDQGVDVGSNTRNLTYLYGLSDFFSFIFEDTETVNLLLEANAITASEVYSKFLQLTSSLSLESIQTFTGTSLKLILLKTADQPDPSKPVYVVDLPIEKVKVLANKPFLPTQTLETEVDFKVIRKDLNSSYIQFARPLSEYKFSSRVGSTGVTEYAIWMSDVLLDEQLMLKHFGELIAVSPEIASDAFSNFIYGLYYVYMHGPTLGLLKRGLNLVLGAPLARAAETVLDIRNYLSSDQYLVITDQNQYLLPFGLLPTISIGDSLSVGELLAEWVELKDYIHDGDWWINVTIPWSVIPSQPPRQYSRFATTGSPFDTLMRNYLKTNCFLVRVKVSNFKNIQQFSQITDIINRAKPTHTQPVYVWAVPDESIIVYVSESAQSISARINDYDHVGIPIEIFRRNNAINPVERGSAHFLRCCVPTFATELVGEWPELGQNQRNYFDASNVNQPVSGFRAFRAALGSLLTYDTAWTQAASGTGTYTWVHQANQYSALGSGPVPITIPEGTPSYRGFSDYITAGKRIVCLYTTTFADISAKLLSLGISSGTMSDRRAFVVGGSNFLPTNYTLLFNKTTGLGSLGPEYPEYSYRTYKPSSGQVGSGDTLLVYKISPTVVGVYWVTTNMTVAVPSLIPVDPWDPLEMHYDVPLNRGSANASQPWYLTRGGALVTAGDIVGSYTDAYNSTPIVTNRSMGAAGWPGTGSLTLVHHVTKSI